MNDCIRILVAEDDADLQFVLKSRLEASGFQVETASTGQEALDRVCETPPDLILLDILMPVKDGFAVVEALRAQPMTEKMPVVLVSGSLDTMHELRKNLPNLCVQGYVTKPFNFPRLVSMIHQIVGR